MNKEKVKVKICTRIQFLKKNNLLKNKAYTYLLLLVVLVFPLCATSFSWIFIEKYNGYYATIFTLYFAIFSYNKQQDKLLEKKQRENELKEKELEDKKNYYRPTFIVVDGDHSKKQIKLLMKNKELYLANCRVYKNVVLQDMFEHLDPLSGTSYINYGASMINIISKKQGPKSGEIIVEDDSDILFIVAETLIGEIVLFGYINNYTFHKYLKGNKNPGIPNDSEELYNRELISDVWGDFNTNEEINDNTLDVFFFGYSRSIRLGIGNKQFKKFENSLVAETLSDFLKNIFIDIASFINEFEAFQESIYKILKNYIILLNSVSGYLFVDSDDEEKFNLLVQEIPENIKFKNKSFKNLYTDISEFLNVINVYIDYRYENFPKDFLQFIDILYLLNNAFNLINIGDPYIDKNILQSNFTWKKLILDIKVK